MTHIGTQFGRAAADYDRGRPSYPLAAVRWLLEGTTGAVADVGAGTGKLTQMVAGLGRDVTAIDPDPVILEALHRALPHVPTAVGTAEGLPLPSGSIGAVVCAQAWHWVDVERASAEAARVLRPGGTLGLIWNIRDAREPWVARLSAVMRGSHAEDLIEGDGPRVGAPFGPLETYREEWSRPVTREEITSLVHSRSYYITGTEDYRAGVDAGLAELLEDLSGLADGGTVTLPYVTHAFRVRHEAPGA